MFVLTVMTLLVALVAAYFARISVQQGRMEASQAKFIEDRRRLNRDRLRLSHRAAELHLEWNQQLRKTGDLLHCEEWIREGPVPVDRCTLEKLWPYEKEGSGGRAHFDDRAGLREKARTILPYATTRERYGTYSGALDKLVPPALFKDRLSYRLSKAKWRDPHGPHLQFVLGRYFDMLDVCEALAHEFIQAGDAGSYDLSSLPLRSEFVDDPLGLDVRSLLPSVNTLTLLKSADGPTTFLLHDRNPKSVAIAGGMMHVIPAGGFQPATKAEISVDDDFDLWRNIAREFAEELLGMKETDGELGVALDYNIDPLSRLMSAKDAGTAQAWIFGFGLDPLTLAGEILTALVIEPDVFAPGELRLGETNDEGTIIGGTPFEERHVRQMLLGGLLAPAAHACLELAWNHRRTLLG